MVGGCWYFLRMTPNRPSDLSSDRSDQNKDSRDRNVDMNHRELQRYLLRESMLLSLRHGLVQLSFGALHVRAHQGAIPFYRESAIVGHHSPLGLEDIGSVVH